MNNKPFLTMRTILVPLLITGFITLSHPVHAQDEKSASQADIEKGKELMFARSKGNCLACHKIPGGELEGTVGPPLYNMRERYPDRELLFKRIWDEREFIPGTQMPPFGPHMILTEKEINFIIDYLYNAEDE